MTNKEAINNLNFIKDYYKDLDDYTINQLRNLTLNLSSVEIKALDKAIKSLEAWDQVIKDLQEYHDAAAAASEIISGTQQFTIENCISIVKRNMGE